MPRHITHPRSDTLQDVHDRAHVRAQLGGGPTAATARALGAVWRRENHRSGRGG